MPAPHELNYHQTNKWTLKVIIAGDYIRPVRRMNAKLEDFPLRKNALLSACPKSNTGSISKLCFHYASPHKEYADVVRGRN